MFSPLIINDSRVLTVMIHPFIHSMMNTSRDSGWSREATSTCASVPRLEAELGQGAIVPDMDGGVLG